MQRGTRGLLPRPIDDIETYWSPVEKARASAMLACSFVGSADTVRRGLERFIAQTGADEIMVASATHDHEARLHSYEVLTGVIRTTTPQAHTALQEIGKPSCRERMCQNV